LNKLILLLAFSVLLLVPSITFDDIFADTRDTTATVSEGPIFSDFDIDDPDGLFFIFGEGADGFLFVGGPFDCSFLPAGFGIPGLENKFFPAIFTISDCADPLEEGVFELTLAGEFTCLSGNCLPLPDGDGQVIGGEIIPIETTSLILAGAQSFSWMIPVVLSVLGIGLFVLRKSENS